ncbi:MFS family permease [Actinoplanes tereljensis]|uniref:MFS transporter n=1 Tax=Paractinoplanes tereljensis TaxID=571912 RepID=A0A919NPG2_9ACTN|nr:MFS transporter [Actinoplanes tereljensis]GIF21644.1 MFS transporter [Actinoplanes tereljensis]
MSLLRDQGFRNLFVADAVSQVGTQVSMLALPLVAVIVLRASNFEVGLLSACETLAFLLVGLPAGALVDRMRRRRVLIVSDIARAALLASVPVAWALGGLTLAQLCLVALATGVFTVFFDVAYQSYLPHLVGTDHLVEGNAKLEGVRATSQIAGPTMAGFLIQLITAPFALLVDALSFAASALFVGRIAAREERPERRPDRHLGREILEGLRFVFGNPLLRAIALCTSTHNLLSAAQTAMLVVLLARDLGLRPGIIGVFYSVAAIGGLVGALVARRIAARIGQGPAIWIPIAACVPAQLVIPLAQPGWLLWAAACAYLVIWAASSIYNITQVSFRQGLTPPLLLGRMNATMRFLVWGTMPIGAFAGGVLGQAIGARPTLWIVAAAGVLPLLPLLASPLRNTRELPGVTPGRVG